MFLPIGDEPNPRQTPVVNYALLGINIGVFILIAWPLSMQPVAEDTPFLMEYLRALSSENGGRPIRDLGILRHLSAYDVFLHQWGFRPVAPSVLTIFTSMFLHGGWMHLLGNCLFLWIFGDNVEAHLGRKRYLAVYLLTGVGATLFFALFQMGSSTPLVGASGAISGVLGCYFLWFPHNRVKVLVVFFFFFQVILIPARYVLLFYLVIDNLLPFLFQSGASNVAHGAHIGGFIAGIGISKILDYRKEKARVEEEWRRRNRPSFGEAIEAKEWEVALESYADMSPGQRRAIGDWDIISLADGLTQAEKFDAGLAVLQRFIATRPNSPLLSLAHLRAGLIHLYGLNRSAAAYQHLLNVLDLSPPSEVESAAREGLAAIEKLNLN